MSTEPVKHIQELDPGLEESIQRNPLLNIDTFIIPSPYIRDIEIYKDYQHSYIWSEEGEILGYMLVYSDREKMNYHIYKIVTSPFGRGRGIGNAFIEHLSMEVSPGATIYLYLWEKQNDTIEYFQNKGFNVLEPVVYRNRRYYHLSASAAAIQDQISRSQKVTGRIGKEDIGKTRHDARKTIRLLSHLVDTLDIGNAGRIIEDINRESTTLVNMLNEFRDSMSVLHEINIQELLLERIIPFIHGSPVSCAIELSLESEDPMIMGYYMSHSRALINIISNSLDAITEGARKGQIQVRLQDLEQQVLLEIRDNGVGIDEGLLRCDERNIPLFVGKSSKERQVGEGLGTVQVFETFGADHIEVQSVKGQGTTWRILLDRPKEREDIHLVRLERRYHEFKDLIQLPEVTGSTPRTEVIAFIWHLRKMEIFLYDIISQFSKEHNIRDIFRTVFSYLEGTLDEKDLKIAISTYRSEHNRFRLWLLDTCRMIRKQKEKLKAAIDPNEYRGPLFRSYGQAANRIMIFTLDPQSGTFFATDRKLAEHLDFVPYLGKRREELLRGEMVGDLNDHSQPLVLGVWSVTSQEDLLYKLRLIREGAKRLLEKSVHLQKRLRFYPVTYLQYSHQINTDLTVTLGEFSQYTDDMLKECIQASDEQYYGFLPIQD